MDAIVTPVPLKPGWFSSEFVLNLFQSLGGLIMSSGLIPHSSPTGTIITQVLGAALTLASVTHWTWIRANLKTVSIHAGVAAYEAALKSVEDDITASDAK